MRTALACCLLLGALHGAAAAETWVARLAPDGRIVWRTALTPPNGAPDPVPLEVPAWFDVLPEVVLETLDGAPVPLVDPGARAVLLDFWASWCAPCLEELPHLERLHRAGHDGGLRVLAVNVDEPGETARRTANALGLTMPVVTLPAALRRVVDLDSLPTLVLLDRSRRVRSTWNGYRPGLEAEVATRARELASSDGVVPTTSAGAVLFGAGAIQVRWHRTLDHPVEGLAYLPYADGSARLVAVVGDSLTALDADGRIVGRVGAASGMGRLHVAEITGDGVDDLIGWREGATRVGIVDMRERRTVSWDAPEPLRALTAAATPTGGRVAAASATGVTIHEPAGPFAGSIAGAARDLAAHGALLAILGPGDTVRVIGADGAEKNAVAVPPGSGALAWISGGTDLGVGSGEVESMAIVRAAAGEWLVASTSDGTVAIVNAANGALLWLAHANGPVRQIAAFGGPGEQEVAVAVGDALLLLHGGRKLADGSPAPPR